jgi:hypothetical protein
MFIENYRQDNMIGGQAQNSIPYPKISDEDWEAWKAFLPVKSAPFCKKVLVQQGKSLLRASYGIPFSVYHKILPAANYFEEIEVWGKREIWKDPIAVGITDSGDRHLICRWGMDKLIPFETIKSRSWMYQIENFGVNLVASGHFWFATVTGTLFAIGYLALWLNA